MWFVKSWRKGRVYAQNPDSSDHPKFVERRRRKAFFAEGPQHNDNIFSIPPRTLADHKRRGVGALLDKIPTKANFYRPTESTSRDAATRLRSNVKEKQWLNETENGEPGHQKTFAH